MSLLPQSESNGSFRRRVLTYEQQFFETVLQRLPESTREQLDALLERYKEEEGEAELEEEEPGIQNLQPEGRPLVVRWRDLKASPGAIGLESVLVETDKLRVLSSLSLPADLFDAVSPRVARLYRERAATEGITELRRHPVAHAVHLSGRVLLATEG